MWLNIMNVKLRYDKMLVSSLVGGIFDNCRFIGLCQLDVFCITKMIDIIYIQTLEHYTPLTQIATHYEIFFVPGSFLL